MQWTRHKRTLSTWIATLAVLLAALVPSISHAIGSGQAASWIEVCSTQGSKWVLSDEREGDPAPAAHLLEHCPVCSLHAQALALPPVPPVLPLRLDLGEAFPTAFLSAPTTLHAWLSAPPRAPPALS